MRTPSFSDPLCVTVSPLSPSAHTMPLTAAGASSKAAAGAGAASSSSQRPGVVVNASAVSPFLLRRPALRSLSLRGALPHVCVTGSSSSVSVLCLRGVAVLATKTAISSDGGGGGDDADNEEGSSFFAGVPNAAPSGFSLTTPSGSKGDRVDESGASSEADKN